MSDDTPRPLAGERFPEYLARIPEYLARVRGIELGEAQRRSDAIDRRIAARLAGEDPESLRRLVAHLVGVLEGHPPALSRDCVDCRQAEEIARQVRNVP